MAFLDIDFAATAPAPTSARDCRGSTSPPPNRGAGTRRFAVESVAAEIRRRGSTRLTTTWHPGEDGPGGFYLGLGFRPTGELSGGQTVGELQL